MMRQIRETFLLTGALLLTTSTEASSGAIERMSDDGFGNEGNCRSQMEWGLVNHISADGRYVTYHSCASNISSLDTASYDIYVYDRDTATNSLVSIASDGTPGNRESRTPSISADGRFVAFASLSTNLLSGIATAGGHIFVHDRDTGTTERISINSNGDPANARSLQPAISADGRYVVFRSDATNLDLVVDDTNRQPDIFVHDRDTGITERVSIASNSDQADNSSRFPSISGDGRYVAFESLASNLALNGDTNGAKDVFVHDRDTGITERVSIATDGTEGNWGSFMPSISADGRYVAWWSSSNNLVVDDTNFRFDVFVRDLQSGTTERVSINSDGIEGNNHSLRPSINADGRYVAFYSVAGNLAAENPRNGVFVHDRIDKTTVLVSRSADGEPANAGGTFVTISPDGTLAAFESSASNLVPTGVRTRQLQVYLKETGLEPSGGDANSPPVANAGGPYSLDEGDSVPLDGSGSSDPDGDLLAYEWDFDFDGSTFQVDASGSATPSFSAAGFDGPGTITVAVRVTDPDGESDVAITEVTVNNVAPVIHSVAGDTINEGGTAMVSGTFSDVGTQDSFTVTIDWGDGITEDFAYAAGSTAFSETHQYPDDNPSGTASDNYSVTVTVTDDDGGSASNSSAAVTVNNVDPDVGDITVDAALVPVGTTITASASFTDVGTEDTHSASWDWGDGATTSGTVGSGSVQGSRAYSGAGVYTVELTVTDDDTGTDSVIHQYVVVYDPSAGFVTGGGWIESPAGAYVADPTLTGRANFGFVSKYKKGQSTPEGSTEFQFKAGDINFHSSSYEWLVVAGHQASFKGVGTINGAGNFGFMLKAVDAKLTPSTDVDRFNIKIWDRDNGDAVVYDNSLGTAGDVEANQDIDGGQIVIHSKGKK